MDIYIIGLNGAGIFEQRINVRAAWDWRQNIFVGTGSGLRFSWKWLLRRINERESDLWQE